MAKISVGYCTNLKCDYLHKPTFMFSGDSTGKHICSMCKCVGLLKNPTSKIEGNYNTFTEAVVEFNYDPCERRYKGAAVVKEEGLKGNKYTFFSPMLKSPSRALKAAENILSRLKTSTDIKEGDLIDILETTISWDRDKEIYKKNLEILEKRWMKLSD